MYICHIQLGYNCVKKGSPSLHPALLAVRMTTAFKATHFYQNWQKFMKYNDEHVLADKTYPFDSITMPSLQLRQDSVKYACSSSLAGAILEYKPFKPALNGPKRKPGLRVRPFCGAGAEILHQQHHKTINHHHDVHSQCHGQRFRSLFNCAGWALYLVDYPRCSVSGAEPCPRPSGRMRLRERDYD